LSENTPCSAETLVDADISIFNSTQILSNRFLYLWWRRSSRRNTSLLRERVCWCHLIKEIRRCGEV